MQTMIAKMTTLKSIHQSRIDENGDLIVESSKFKKEKKKLGLPAEYLSLGIYLTLPLVFSVIIGPKLDKYFDTQNLFTILFIVIGTISVFYNLYKLYSEDESTHKH